MLYSPVITQAAEQSSASLASPRGRGVSLGLQSPENVKGSFSVSWNLTPCPDPGPPRRSALPAALPRPTLTTKPALLQPASKLAPVLLRSGPLFLSPPGRREDGGQGGVSRASLWVPPQPSRGPGKSRSWLISRLLHQHLCLVAPRVLTPDHTPPSWRTARRERGSFCHVRSSPSLGS